MKKSLASAVGGVAVVGAVFGAGVAGAVNEYAGLTYEQAANSMNSRNLTPVIVSRVGSYLPTEKCIITSSRKPSILDSSGRDTGGRSVYLVLNCNDSVAGEHPGNSAVTPQGAKAKAQRDAATAVSESYAKSLADGTTPWCADKMQRCKRVCETAGTCSADLLEYLGM